MTAILERALELCGKIQNFDLPPYGEFDGTYQAAQLLRQLAIELKAITFSINYPQYQAMLADCDLEFDASDYDATVISLSRIKSVASLLECVAADQVDDPTQWTFPEVTVTTAVQQEVQVANSGKQKAQRNSANEQSQARDAKALSR